MAVFLLKDLADDSVDAVILSVTSSQEEIENAIREVKQIDGYTWEDIYDALPSDCTVYDKWSNLKQIYY